MNIDWNDKQPAYWITIEHNKTSQQSQGPERDPPPLPPREPPKNQSPPRPPEQSQLRGNRRARTSSSPDSRKAGASPRLMRLQVGAGAGTCSPGTHLPIDRPRNFERRRPRYRGLFKSPPPECPSSAAHWTAAPGGASIFPRRVRLPAKIRLTASCSAGKLLQPPVHCFPFRS